MTRRTNWLFSLLLLAAIAMLALPGCRVAQASDGDPRVPTLMVLPAVQGDTALAFVLTWQPPAVGGRQGQIASYDTRLVDAANDTLDVGTTTSAPDTLYAPLILNDTLRVKGCVRAVDQYDLAGPFACSATLTVVVGAEPPGPPGGVGIDTLPFPQLVRIDVGPDDINLTSGFGVAVYQAVLYDGLGRALACSQALFTEGPALTGHIVVPDGVCTGVNLMVVDSVLSSSGAYISTPFQVANAVDWSSALMSSAPSTDSAGAYGTYRIDVLLDWDTIVTGFGDLPVEYWYTEVDED